MNFKTTILSLLDSEQLRWYLEAYRLPERPSSRQAVVGRLAACADLTLARLLEPLYEVDVKRACEAVGVSSKGRRKGLIDRLLASGGAPPPPASDGTSSFVAIDFETADQGRDSACALAVVRVDGASITRKAVRLIRPPRSAFVFSYIHGITWARVRNEPSFDEVWRDMQPLLEGARFIAAHNASFDRSVLKACCESARMSVPDLPFECTVKLARKKWDLYPTKLPNVCSHLGIPLTHHDAGSDAEACARIVLAARG